MPEEIKENKLSTSIMLSPEEKSCLMAICKADKRSMSFILGQLCVEEFKRRNLELPPKPSTS